MATSICPKCYHQSKTNEKFCCKCGSAMVERYVIPWWFFLISFFVAFFVCIIIPFPDNRFFAAARPLLCVAVLLIPPIVSVIVNAKKKTTADSSARNNALKVHDNNEDYQMEPHTTLITDDESIEKRISPTIGRAIPPTQEMVPKIVYSICPNCKYESGVGEESYCCKCGSKLVPLPPKKMSKYWRPWFLILVLGLVLSIVVSCGSKSIGFPFLGMFFILLWGSTLLYSWRRNDWILFFSCLGIAALLFELKLQGDRRNAAANEMINRGVHDLNGIYEGVTLSPELEAALKDFRAKKGQVPSEDLISQQNRLNEDARKVYNATIKDLQGTYKPPEDIPEGLRH